MAEQQIKQLQQKLQQQQAQFQRYKSQCKQLQTFLQGESTKKQQQIRKLKQQAILKQKSFGPLKAQVSQLQSENGKLKAELLELQAKGKEDTGKADEFAKIVEELRGNIGSLEKEKEGLLAKISELEAKVEAGTKVEKGPKGKGDADTKKLEEAVANYKAKIADLEKSNDKLKEELARKASVKHQQKKVEHKSETKDNKQEDKLKEKIQKLQKKVSQYHSDIGRSEQKNVKLAKQLKQARQKLSQTESERQSLSKKLKQLSSSFKKQAQPQQQEQGALHGMGSQANLHEPSPTQSTFSALLLTKKHYISPFLEQKSQNVLKLYKNTKNGCFQKSLGSTKYKLNSITYDPAEVVDNCVAKVVDSLAKGVKCSVVILGSKKTSKKYILGDLVTKIRDFVVDKLGQSEEPIEAYFLKASPDPEKRIQMHANNSDQVEQILDKIQSLAQKSPKKPSNSQKQKQAPRPKCRYFRLTQGSLYLQIITTSFTNISHRQNQSLNEALNNITYSRLPNTLQPLDTYKYIIFTLNPIVSLYEDCKNALSIVNCKKVGVDAEESHEMQGSPNKQQLNDTARKKLQTIQRQNQQTHLKLRKHQQQITFYRTKFDELQVRLKNLLNTHRQQNSYLKKSPVTLSYEKMLKFVHSVQAKNGANNAKVQEKYASGSREFEDEDGEGMREGVGDDGGDIL